MDLAASSHRCFQRKLPIGRGAPVLVEKVLRPQSKPSAAKSVGAMVLSFLNALCREERESPRVLRKALRPGPGLHLYTPATGVRSAPVRGQPHISISHLYKREDKRDPAASAEILEEFLRRGA